MSVDRSTSEEEIEQLILKHEKAVANLKKVLSDFQSLKKYEVGIRKSNNQVVHITYSVGFPNGSFFGDEYTLEILIHVLPPTGGTPYKVTIDEFKNEYIEYSPKSRVILPKRER